MSEFKLGEHEGRLQAIESWLQSIDTKVDALVTAHNERNGAWKIVALGGAFVGAVVAFLGNLLSLKIGN